MTDKHYRALKDSFCMYGHLDCIVDDTYGTGVLLCEMLEETRVRPTPLIEHASTPIL